MPLISHKNSNYLYINKDGRIQLNLGKRKQDGPVPASLSDLRKKAAECFQSQEFQAQPLKETLENYVAVIDEKIDSHNQKLAAKVNAFVKGSKGALKSAIEWFFSLWRLEKLNISKE